jgi:hypothetical protein
MGRRCGTPLPRATPVVGSCPVVARYRAPAVRESFVLYGVPCYAPHSCRTFAEPAPAVASSPANCGFAMVQDNKGPKNSGGLFRKALLRWRGLPTTERRRVAGIPSRVQIACRKHVVWSRRQPRRALKSLGNILQVSGGPEAPAQPLCSYAKTVQVCLRDHQTVAVAASIQDGVSSQGLVAHGP